MRGLSLLSLLLFVTPGPPTGGGVQEIATTCEYVILSQAGPAPVLVYAFPAPFAPGVAASTLPARWEASTRQLTIYLPGSAAPVTALKATVGYRRGRALTLELWFPPASGVPFPPRGADLSTLYDPAAQTLAVPLP